MKDIFDQIREIENGNIHLYDSLTEEEKNDINPYMLLKWLSYTNDPKQILHLNALVNTKLFAFGKHKELLYYLCCASSKGKHHYKWLKRDLKKESALIGMIMDAHNCGKRDAIEILELYSKDELNSLCDDMNLDKLEAAKIKKEINVL